MSSPRFPPEILDYIIDFLSDDTETLKLCCLVSKPWVSRARTHIFARISFNDGDHFKWRKTFSDPTNSPACHAHTLFINCNLVDAEESWLQAFSRVEWLVISKGGSLFPNGLTRLRSLSPSVKSLYISFSIPHPHFHILICSLPLLEDLMLNGQEITSDQYGWDEPTGTFPPSTSPALTGTLDFHLFEGMVHTQTALLYLQGGFTSESSSYGVMVREDSAGQWYLWWRVPTRLNTSRPRVKQLQLQSGHIDLSKATKLKDVFRCESLESGWITRTLETVTPKHPGFQQISIHIPIALGYLPAGMCAAFERYFDEASPGMHWWDLDRLLVWLWEFQSIRVKVMCPQLHGMNGGRQMRDWARYLFPELTRGNASIIGAFSTIE